MTDKQQKEHQLAMRIIELLIESGLSIHEQLKVIKSAENRLNFCKRKGGELKQLKLEL